MIQIDHLFVYADPMEAALESIAGRGLQESWRVQHSGQGTACLAYCFDDFYLELLWHADDAKVAASPLARAKAPQRADWRRTGASPFGIGLRCGPGAYPLPFATWDYQPPFFQPGTIMPIAVSSDEACQPVVFVTPYGERPDRWPQPHAGERQTRAGLSELASLHLDLPQGVKPGEALQRLAEMGVLTLGEAETHRMTLTLTATDGGTPSRLVLPEFSWS